MAPEQTDQRFGDHTHLSFGRQVEVELSDGHHHLEGRRGITPASLLLWELWMETSKAGVANLFEIESYFKGTK